jgi:hypothetical protein
VSRKARAGSGQGKRPRRDHEKPWTLALLNSSYIDIISMKYEKEEVKRPRDQEINGSTVTSSP